MLEWIVRGLRAGVVTTRYPRASEPAPDGFRGRVRVLQAEHGSAGLEALCPTAAIAVRQGRVSLDRRRCILCGLCVSAEPERFAFEAQYETAEAADTRPALGKRTRTLRRSIHIRHVDAGSDGSEEWEIQALTNPYYDMQRLGLSFTLSPRHADILLVTGSVAEPMREPLLRAWEAMPEPKAVVAAGTDACSGGLATAGDGIAGSVDRVLPVDVFVPGSPPSPIALLNGLLIAAGVVTAEEAA